MPVGCATVVAAWIRHLRGQGAPVNDPGAAPYLAVVDGDDETAVRAVLDLLDSGAGSDDDLVTAVLRQLAAVVEQGGVRRE